MICRWLGSGNINSKPAHRIVWIPAGREWDSVARKKQEIKVVAHVPEDVALVFGGTHAEEFWIKIISEKIEKCGLTAKGKKQLLDAVEGIGVEPD